MSCVFSKTLQQPFKLAMTDSCPITHLWAANIVGREMYLHYLLTNIVVWELYIDCWAANIVGWEWFIVGWPV